MQLSLLPLMPGDRVRFLFEPGDELTGTLGTVIRVSGSMAQCRSDELGELLCCDVADLQPL
ncbi:MAG: hypothetical protein IGS50_12430 [Synechococcales cyanobacterium C42_A2020_086]|jgi:hypothetical protein|nr:hypothetical protein [Synechococcales cyanobacterium C42_A2020_086]